MDCSNRDNKPKAIALDNEGYGTSICEVLSPNNCFDCVNCSLGFFGIWNADSNKEIHKEIRKRMMN